MESGGGSQCALGSRDRVIRPGYSRKAHFLLLHMATVQDTLPNAGEVQWSEVTGDYQGPPYCTHRPHQALTGLGEGDAS